MKVKNNVYEVEGKGIKKKKRKIARKDRES